MSKKPYTKPTVASRTTALGVFGSYGNDPDGSGGGNVVPTPYKPLTDRKLDIQ